MERNFAVLGPFCGICRLRDYSALRASPTRFARGRRRYAPAFTSLRDVPLHGVSNPAYSSVGGFELCAIIGTYGAALLRPLMGICQLRDSNRRHSRLFRKRLQRLVREVTPKSYPARGLDIVRRRWTPVDSGRSPHGNSRNLYLCSVTS